MNPDDVLDEMANAFDEEWDLDCKTEDQLRAALRVLYRECEFKEPHILRSLLYSLAFPGGSAKYRRDPDKLMEDAQDILAEMREARGGEE